MTLDDISKVNRRSENIYDYGPLEDYFTAIPSEKSNDWFTGNVRLLEYGGNVVKKVRMNRARASKFFFSESTL